MEKIPERISISVKARRSRDEKFWRAFEAYVRGEGRSVSGGLLALARAGLAKAGGPRAVYRDALSLVLRMAKENPVAVADTLKDEGCRFCGGIHGQHGSECIWAEATAITTAAAESYAGGGAAG